MLWLNDLAATKRLFLAILPALVATSVVAGDYAFVTNQSSSDVSVLDLSKRTEVARVPAPGKPAGIATHAQSGAYYVVSPDSKILRKFSQSDDSLLGAVALDGGPIGIALSPDGQRAFVSDWYNARIWVVDTTTMSVHSALKTGTSPAGLAVSSDGRWLACADKDANQVTLFDLDAMQLHRVVEVGIRPFGLTFGPRGRLFVGNVGSNDVSVIDPVQDTPLATLKVGQRPYGVAFARGKGFVTNQYSDTVSVFDLDDLADIATIDVGEYPEGIDVTTDGQTVVVANWFSNTVSLIDADTLDVVAEIETGDGPRAFGLFVSATIGRSQ